MDEFESLSHSKWECKYHVVAGFVITGSSTPPRCTARCAHWTASWFAGRDANTNDFEAMRCVRGIGSTGFAPDSRPYSLTGASHRRLDDRSRMNREVHVRFWEGVGVKFPCATQLPARLRDRERSAQWHRTLSGVLQSPTPAQRA